jgi:TonB family protein
MTLVISRIVRPGRMTRAWARACLLSPGILSALAAPALLTVGAAGVVIAAFPTSVTAQGVVGVGGDIKPPVQLKRVEPEYPPLAKAARMQGPVYIEAIIATDGRVREAKVTGGAPFPPLREAALNAVKQWEYAQTLVNGVPVEVQLTTQVMFRLAPNSASAKPTPITNAYPLDDPTAQVRAGDLLVVDIAGEDQLPRWYVVEAGGAIRLPLLGSVQVTDLTAQAAAAAVRQALSERQLVPGSGVTVVIHRSKQQ